VDYQLSEGEAQMNAREKGILDHILKGVNELTGLSREQKIRYFRSLVVETLNSPTEKEIQGYIDCIK